MRRILFLVRSSWDYSGMLIKIRDYVEHSLLRPGLETDVYFRDAVDVLSDTFRRSLWGDLPLERIVPTADPMLYDAIVAQHKGWRSLPNDRRSRRKLINILQTLGARGERRSLQKPANRICVSQELYEEYTPLMVGGHATVIPSGIPLDLFKPGGERADRSLLIWGSKSPALGVRLQEALAKRDLNVELLLDFLPRREFAQRLARCDIFVTLPFEAEAFHLPALEAMACGAAVVCADAFGNRSFCVHDDTCMMPAFDDFESHIAMIDLLLADEERKERIRGSGVKMAQAYSLEGERERFYQFLDDVVFPSADGGAGERSAERRAGRF